MDKCVFCIIQENNKNVFRLIPKLNIKIVERVKIDTSNTRWKLFFFYSLLMYLTWLDIKHDCAFWCVVLLVVSFLSIELSSCCSFQFLIAFQISLFIGVVL